MSNNYQLKGNPVMQVPVIGNLVFDELGKEVISKLNERFKGVRDIEYTQEHKPDEPISYSNIPRALAINNILREISNGQIRVLSPEDAVRYWDFIPDKKHTADTDSIAIYQNPGSNEDLRQIVLKLIGKTSNLPSIVSGLGIERADNDYGFNFTGTDYMESKEAPFLRKDGRVSYNPSKGKLVSSNEGVSVWTPSAQSGLGGLYLSRCSGLDARGVNLLYASGSGRVKLISGAVAPKNLESYLAQLEREKANQIAKIEEKFQQAMSILRL